MTTPILPIIKALAPYIAQVATSAIPAFTAKQKESPRNDPIVAKQIEELQNAAKTNAESIHILADKIQQAINAIENEAHNWQRQAALFKTTLFVSLGLSVVSILTCMYLLLR